MSGLHALFSAAWAVIATGGGLADQALRVPEAERPNQVARCQRPAPTRFDPGATRQVIAPASAACKIEIRTTNVRLRPDDAGNIEGLGLYVARNAAGYLYTAAGRGRIAGWTPRGQLDTVFGRIGGGPGEFRAGSLFLHVGPAGDLYVKDNTPRWSIYSSGNAFRRTGPADRTEAHPERSMFLPDGTFLVAPASGPPTSHYFNLYRPQPPNARGSAAAAPAVMTLIKSFGDVHADDARVPPSRRRVLLTSADLGSFWAASADGRRGYRVEQWSTNGKLVQALQRDVPWFPQNSGSAMQQPGGSRPPARFTVIHADTGGLLFVGIVVPNARWKDTPRVSTPAQRDSLRSEMLDLYFEVIDTRSATLLATSGRQSYDAGLNAYPYAFFHDGGNTGYRRLPLGDDLWGIELVSYVLTSR